MDTHQTPKLMDHDRSDKNYDKLYTTSNRNLESRVLRGGRLLCSLYCGERIYQLNHNAKDLKKFVISTQYRSFKTSYADISDFKN